MMVNINHIGKIGIVVLLFVIFAVIFGAFAPIPVMYSDFMSLYHAVSGWKMGHSIYDYAFQHTLMMQTKPDKSIAIFPYFPYPPWYAGTFFFLSYLSFEHAYSMWFILNLGILTLSVQLLMAETSLKIRVTAVAVFLSFFPAYGLLVVGNYTLPVLLGGALFIYEVRRRSASLSAIGLVLMTYKPHVGLFMALAGLIYLLRQKSEFTKQTFLKILVPAMIVLLIGFIIEPDWIVTFPGSLFSWQASSTINVCTYCASVANTITRVASNRAGPLSSGMISLILLAATGTWIWFCRKNIFDSAEASISVGATLTAIVSPYMVNYDFVILIIPISILFLMPHKKRFGIWLALMILAPSLTMVFGRAIGNMVLLAIDMILFLIFLYPGMLTATGAKQDNKL